jgi:hypothetical protein
MEKAFAIWCLILGIIWVIVSTFVWIGMRDEKAVAKDDSWKIFQILAFILFITAISLIIASILI